MLHCVRCLQLAQGWRGAGDPSASRHLCSTRILSAPAGSLPAASMNQDGARQCLDKAKEALRSNNLDKAQRLLQRSLKLHPTAEAESLLRRLQASASAAGAGAAGSSSPPRQQQQRAAPSSSPQSQARGKSAAAPTDAHMTRILKAKTLYEVLDVTQDANGSVIKKAYRKVRAAAVCAEPRGSAAAERRMLC